MAAKRGNAPSRGGGHAARRAVYKSFAGTTALVLSEGDITSFRGNAIVNAANEEMLGGGGVDGAIHRAAGGGLLQLCRLLPEVSEDVRCPTGFARILPAPRLPCGYVIFTTGPIFRKSNAQRAAAELTACYRNCLMLAQSHGFESIAFPAISCGVYRFPESLAASLSLDACRQYGGGGTLRKIEFVMFDAKCYDAWKHRLRELGCCDSNAPTPFPAALPPPDSLGEATYEAAATSAAAAAPSTSTATAPEPPKKVPSQLSRSACAQGATPPALNHAESDSGAFLSVSPPERLANGVGASVSAQSSRPTETLSQKEEVEGSKADKQASRTCAGAASSSGGEGSSMEEKYADDTAIQQPRESLGDPDAAAAAADGAGSFARDSGGYSGGGGSGGGSAVGSKGSDGSFSGTIGGSSSSSFVGSATNGGDLSVAALDGASNSSNASLGALETVANKVIIASADEGGARADGEADVAAAVAAIVGPSAARADVDTEAQNGAVSALAAAAAAPLDSDGSVDGANRRDAPKRARGGGDNGAKHSENDETSVESSGEGHKRQRSGQKATPTSKAVATAVCNQKRAAKPKWM